MTAVNVLNNTQVQTLESFSHESIVLRLRFSMTQESVHCEKRTLSDVLYTTAKVFEIRQVATHEIAVNALIGVSVESTHNIMHNRGRGNKSFSTSEQSTRKPYSIDKFAAYTFKFISK